MKSCRGLGEKCVPALQNSAVLSAAARLRVTVQLFLCLPPPVSQRCVPFPFRKDLAEQLGNSSGVGAAAGTALAHAEATAGAQHQGRHAGIQILAG